MDRGRQRAERYGDYSDPRLNSHSATSSWSSDDPPPPHHDPNFDAHRDRADFSGDGHQHYRHHYHHRQHHYQYSNHRHHHYHQNFNSEQNESLTNSDHSLSLPGRKRQFVHSGHDYVDGGRYVKLYVVGIPRTGTEQEIRSLFEEYGNIVEVVLLKDKRTGQQGECCFVKYATLEEADRAIGALHDQYTFPAGFVPLKVRYADGERERLGGFGTHEYKLYVGCLNKQSSKMEIEEIFSAYGIVENVYIVCDDLKQSRGSGFVQFSHKDMAVAAMNALNGNFIMRGCDQPLIVRFADPKKPRMREPRDNCKFGGSSIGSRFQESVVRPLQYLNDQMAEDMLLSASLPPSPKTMPSSSQSPGTGVKPQTVSNTPAPEIVFPSSTSSGVVVPKSAHTADSLDCDWSEHTCPDGYMYYYNCVTCESKWEKPEEYFLFEQQLQQQQQQQQHSSCQQEDRCLSNPLVFSAQEVSQT
ncbi:flowering time control protein FCA-like isoform X2 [Actinidia eriantha]|uniref:flowering time control protein FCA-like isoform X2 n=1 Tax=Actinidia eriantha TaxID=165200 RepID=UPI00258E2FEA|nr:flowering time control protein FCA-like isoform X2 [Actinidia eriantha]